MARKRPTALAVAREKVQNADAVVDAVIDAIDANEKARTKLQTALKHALKSRSALLEKATQLEVISHDENDSSSTA
jgi:hypothetical protein